jgi:hypothetical protein
MQAPPPVLAGMFFQFVSLAKAFLKLLLNQIKDVFIQINQVCDRRILKYII